MYVGGGVTASFEATVFEVKCFSDLDSTFGLDGSFD